MRKENATQDHQPEGALSVDHCAKVWGGPLGLQLRCETRPKESVWVTSVMSEELFFRH